MHPGKGDELLRLPGDRRYDGSGGKCAAKVTERYKEEKEKRKKDNLIQRRETQKELIYTKRKNKKDTDFIDMKKKHEQAAKELSKHSSIGNQDLRKWCSSAYKYNEKKKCYEFDTKNLLKPHDFPMYIKV